MTKEALKLALEVLEQTLQTLDDENAKPGGAIADTIWHSKHETLFDYLGSEITAIKEELAQPEQEPVAWIHNFIEGGISIGKRPSDLNRHPDRWAALYRESKPCPTCEALARTVMLDQTSHDTKRPWVGLTDEDRAEIAAQGHQRWKEYAQAIEDKLKEKNT